MRFHALEKKLIDFDARRENRIECIRQVIKSLESHLSVLKAENLIQWRKSLHFTVERTDITRAAGLMILPLTSLPGNIEFGMVPAIFHQKSHSFQFAFVILRENTNESIITIILLYPVVLNLILKAA